MFPTQRQHVCGRSHSALLLWARRPIPTGADVQPALNMTPLTLFAFPADPFSSERPADGLGRDGKALVVRLWGAADPPARLEERTGRREEL